MALTILPGTVYEYQKYFLFTRIREKYSEAWGQAIQIQYNTGERSDPVEYKKNTYTRDSRGVNTNTIQYAKKVLNTQALQAAQDVRGAGIFSTSLW